MAAPLDTVMTAILAANTRLNGSVETLQPIGGQIVGNTQSFSQQVVNDSWRRLQNKLADMRYSGVQNEQVFTAVPAVASTDPAVQVYWNWSGFYDGVTLQGAPVLPANLIRPYELTERASGTTNLFTNMDIELFNLPRVAKASWNRQWVWRNNTIYMPGALVPTDIALTYAQLLADFLDVGSVQWFQAQIPILNCVDSLAYYICAEIKTAVGDGGAAAAFSLAADDAAMMVVNQDTTSPKSIAKASEYLKMSDSRTPTNGPLTQQIKRA